MLKRLLGVAALLCLLAPATFAQAPARSAPRVSAMYTTWDDYYFYAGFQVHDPNVISTNTTPTSQPQQDDDVEVFFETDNARATVRTPQTYQMAVSAGNGAYFSVGDGTRVPQAKVVYTYKYAAQVDGALNNPTDTDIGYTVELAIPWQELGQSGPPKDGTTWGFNALSRDRDTADAPAGRFFSLSPLVQSAADVQDPAKWSHITFTTAGVASETVDQVVSPHTTLNRFPDINGSIVSGEWPGSSRLTYGTASIVAAAPTVAEEPNTTQSAFNTPPPAQLTPTPPPVAPPVVVPVVPKAPPVAEAPPTTIDLPNGGSIKIAPGGIKNPAGLEPPSQVASAGPFTNPLTPRIPEKYQPAFQGNDYGQGIAPPLGPNVPPRLVMALYRLDYNGDGRKAPSQNVWDAQGASLLVDQPMNGAGPWFSALRPLWHRQQLTDMRRAGIEVALLQVHADDPLLDRELDALVEALKEMKAAGQDYPLIGVNLYGNFSEQAFLSQVYGHIPSEFRAMGMADGGADNRQGVLVHPVMSAGENVGPVSRLSDGTPVSNVLDNYPPVKVVVISPGGMFNHELSFTPGIPKKFTSRLDGARYTSAWQEADAATRYVIINSWNDFTFGTDVAASRQYGERYSDDTRIATIAFNGNRQWHAKYLKANVPTTILPKTLYQVPVRIENAGTLPWRAGEGYSLCARWYTADGRLADDSAPRIPIGRDVLPGQTVTQSFGLVARNSYGDDLDPGDYILVVDMVQGQNKWFSYAGDNPLQVRVHVAAANDATVKPQATFLGTTTPTTGATGGDYRPEVDVRNDGPAAWTGNKFTLAYKIVTDIGGMENIRAAQEKGLLPPGLDHDVVIGDLVMAQGKGEPLSPVAIVPGQVIPVVPHLHLTVLPGKYHLHWFIQDADGKPLPGSYDESLTVTPTDPGASFVLSDVPREMDAGKDTTAKLAVQNLSSETWTKGSQRVGYHWYYLDGTEAQWNGGIFSPFTKDVPPGRADGDIVARVHAPDQPGRYCLVWDVQRAEGTWDSLSPASKGDDLLQTIITVTGKNAGSVPVDLSKAYNGTASDFDGQGHGLPDAMLPPDGTAEVDSTNPLGLANDLGSTPGPPLYPDGFYAGRADHALPFLYGSASRPNNLVICRGQTIGLPGGNYKAIHLLAAASDGQAVSAAFGVGGASQAFPIADWAAAPSAGTAPGFHSPYIAGKDTATDTPVTLGDYVLKLDPSQRVDKLTLPNAPAVKIVAITLER